MFPPRRPSPLAQRALAALRLLRSFALLEDDDRVDWGLDRDEPRPLEHPHRTPLRGRATSRRPGRPAPTDHACLSPVASTIASSAPRTHRREEPARATRKARATPGDLAGPPPPTSHDSPTAPLRVSATTTGRPQAARP
jgi:hypothetical protein